MEAIREMIQQGIAEGDPGKVIGAIVIVVLIVGVMSWIHKD